MRPVVSLPFLLKCCAIRYSISTTVYSFFVFEVYLSKILQNTVFEAVGTHMSYDGYVLNFFQRRTYPHCLIWGANLNFANATMFAAGTDPGTLAFLDVGGDQMDMELPTRSPKATGESRLLQDLRKLPDNEASCFLNNVWSLVGGSVVRRRILLCLTQSVFLLTT